MGLIFVSLVILIIVIVLEKKIFTKTPKREINETHMNGKRIIILGASDLSTKTVSENNCGNSCEHNNDMVDEFDDNKKLDLFEKEYYELFRQMPDEFIRAKFAVGSPVDAVEYLYELNAHEIKKKKHIETIPFKFYFDKITPHSKILWDGMLRM